MVFAGATRAKAIAVEYQAITARCSFTKDQRLSVPRADASLRRGERGERRVEIACALQGEAQQRNLRTLECGMRRVEAEQAMWREEFGDGVPGRRLQRCPRDIVPAQPGERFVAG